MPIQGLYKIFDKWHENGAVWIISDPHFGDKELELAVPGRPNAEAMVKAINSKVGKKDTLICLGDVGDVSYVKQLKGYKVLIMGNHDSGCSNYEHCWWKEWFDKEEYTKEEALAEMKKMYPNCKYTVDETWSFSSPFESWEIEADNMLFNEVYEGPLMISEKLILSHEPVDVPWAFNIHGHDHSGRSNDERHFNVCSDVINYTPINFNQWMKQGYLSKIETLHRTTIDTATVRKSKREAKKNAKGSIHRY